jgi:hypothetical protein
MFSFSSVVPISGLPFSSRRYQSLSAKYWTNRFSVNARSVKIKEKKRVRGFVLQRDRFNSLDFFGSERELFGLEVFFHTLPARGSGLISSQKSAGKA